MYGGYCPYACKSGMYSAQWDPNSAPASGSNGFKGTNSMHGGLICNSDGTLTKPRPDQPLCLPGSPNVYLKNTLGASVSTCQTVFPGKYFIDLIFYYTY